MYDYVIMSLAFSEMEVDQLTPAQRFLISERVS